ncbi:MAG: transcription termination factor NusA [Planctomycetes bacterium]|nr:transcription termination factor NusA [Planctomycetota bacterium]
MNPEMLRIIDSIARDRNIDKESLYTDIEQAMVSAARKHFNAEDTDEFSSTLDRLTGKIQLFRSGVEIPLESLGRIPAQTAKQVMIQKFREDERASIYDEFSDRIGELVTGTAQRYEGGSLVISLGRAEGFMPRSEQIPGEQHQPGERVRCMILDVRDMGHQVKIVLSRAAPDFIRRLFEVEVPEVTERIIEIKALAREPGHRTKVAVSSIDSKVDAVGACVGVRGSRIKNIVDELGGEKIDVVRWNESSQVLIANALRPAEIVEISLFFELGRATVVVNEDQLSLAIGKRGQNVRLAARLTSWDVDILTPAEFARGLDILDETLKSVEGVTEEMIDRMAALGMITVFDVEEVGEEVLVEQVGNLGMTPELAAQVVTKCSERAKVVAQQQQQERELAEKKKAEEAAAIAAQPGEAQAASILGDLLGGGASRQAAASAPKMDESGSIMDMLASRRSADADESGEEPGGDGPHDVAMAEAEAEARSKRQASPAEIEIEQSQDETEIAKLATGEAETDEDESES